MIPGFFWLITSIFHLYSSNLFNHSKALSDSYLGFSSISSSLSPFLNSIAHHSSKIHLSASIESNFFNSVSNHLGFSSINFLYWSFIETPCSYLYFSIFLPILTVSLFGSSLTIISHSGIPLFLWLVPFSYLLSDIRFANWHLLTRVFSKFSLKVSNNSLFACAKTVKLDLAFSIVSRLFVANL